MGSLTSSNRLTSKDLRVEYIPCGTTPATHDENFVLNDTDGGTFAVQVNGERTADITYDETTQGDTATAIQTAIDGLPNLDTGELTVTGSASDGGTEDDTFRFLAGEDGWYRIDIFDTGLTTSGSGANPSIERDATVVGTQVFNLTGEMSSFSFDESTETTDMTALSEFDRTEEAVSRTMSWEFMAFDANEFVFDHVLEASQQGLVTVFKEGKVAGRKYFAFLAEITGFSEDFPDHDKLEIDIQGNRLGENVVPKWTIYRP